MKRFIPLSFVLLLAALAMPALAQQDSQVITLTDTAPSVEAVITLPPDTTGTISLDVVMAAVTLTDSAGNVVFSAADPRLHAIELDIAPNTGSHTLTVERLPGVQEAYVSVTSLAEMTVNGSVQRVETNAVSLNQETALFLDAANPGGSAVVSIPADTTGTITATFPGADAETRLIDSNGTVIMASYKGHVDAVNLVLDGGEYQFALLANGLTNNVVAGVRVVPSDESGFTILEAPAASVVVATSNTDDCTATVAVSSVNLRSGPGTGYSVLGYGYWDETLKVGGRNPENNWIVVGTDTGSAWIAASAAQLNSACETLPVFNIPYREAQPAPVVVTTIQQPATVFTAPSVVQQPATFPTYQGDDDHHDDHDDHEGSEHENDD